jgi:hypothetical protein
MSTLDVAFFVHIPKAAGTSMTDVIRSQYGAEQLLRLPTLNRAEVAKRFRELPDSVKIIAGHAPLGSRVHLSRPCRAFSVLREPVARIISLHTYIGREKTHRWHELYHSGELTLGECARRQRNLQTRFLSGVERPKEVPEDELLELAKRELEHGLVTFGLAERFAETILLFNAMLGWNVQAYASSNVAKRPARRDEIPEEQLEEVRRCNAMDVELYALAEKLFCERLDRLVPNWEAALPGLESRVSQAELKAGLWRTFKGWLSRSG